MIALSPAWGFPLVCCTFATSSGSLPLQPSNSLPTRYDELVQKKPILLDLTKLPWAADLPTHFVFDVDGTLTNADTVLTTETNAALKKIFDAQIPIIIATGRPLEWSKYILRDAKINAWIVASNGAVVYDGFTQQLAKVHLLPAQLAQQSLETANELGVAYFVENAHEIWASAQNKYIPQVSQVALQRSTGLREFPLTQESEIDFANLTKFAFAAPPAKIDEIQELIAQRFPAAVRGGPEFLDITLPHVTKLVGIEFAQQQLGLSSQTGLGVGDSGNDVPWLGEMGISVAAPHATPDLLAQTQFILPDTQNPVADLINAILARN